MSLSVRRQEVVGVAGILGSGASEVVELLTGQRRPISGSVSVGAAKVKPTAPHKVIGSGVGFVSGDRSSLVMKPMTVSEHVALPRLGKLARLGLISTRVDK